MKGPGGRFLIPALLAGMVVMQAVAPTASAAENDKQTGWFFEAGVGTIRDRNDMASNVSTGGSPYAKRGYLGYAITRYFGLQGGFVSGDTVEYKRDAGGPGLIDNYDYQGYHGKVFVSIPFRRDNDGFYAVTFTGGTWRWDATVESPTGGNFHSHGVSPTASVGLIFADRSIALKIEYERFRLKPQVADGDFTKNGKIDLNYDVISLGLQFFL